MRAGGTGKPDAGDLGDCFGRGNVHRAAFAQLAIAQPQVGLQRAATVQLQPRLADEQGRDPVERGERPFAAHRAGTSLQQLRRILEGNVTTGDVQVRIHFAARAGSGWQACLQAQVIGHIELKGQHAAIGSAVPKIERHLP